MDFIKKFQKWMLKHQRRKTKRVRRRRMHEPSSQDSLRMQIWTSSLRKLRLMKRTSKVRTMQQYFPKKVLVHYIVFGSERIFWSERMKNALGVGFLYQLSPSQRTTLSFPVVDFMAAAPGLKKLSNDQIKIFVTTDSFFVTKFREIFQRTRQRHTITAESKKWLYGPNIQYWSQQLNFAVFCATQGCEI